MAVTVLVKDGLPNAELIGKIQAALSAEKRRPLCDTVVVKAPTAVDYTLDAELTLFTGTDARTAKAAAEQAWAVYEAARRSRLGCLLGELITLLLCYYLYVYFFK